MDKTFMYWKIEIGLSFIIMPVTPVAQFIVSGTFRLIQTLT